MKMRCPTAGLLQASRSKCASERIYADTGYRLNRCSATPCTTGSKQCVEGPCPRWRLSRSRFAVFALYESHLPLSENYQFLRCTAAPARVRPKGKTLCLVDICSWYKCMSFIRTERVTSFLLDEPLFSQGPLPPLLLLLPYLLRDLIICPRRTARDINDNQSRFVWCYPCDFMHRVGPTDSPSGSVGSPNRKNSPRWARPRMRESVAAAAARAIPARFMVEGGSKENQAFWRGFRGRTCLLFFLSSVSCNDFSDIHSLRLRVLIFAENKNVAVFEELCLSARGLCCWNAKFGGMRGLRSLEAQPPLSTEMDAEFVRCCT